MLTKWAKWASAQWNFFVWLKTDLISFFIYGLCYKVWFSRPASNVLSPAFNWAKWVKWVTQSQELNVSLWNWLHWIQCLRIGLRDIISYFITKCSFWRSFCWGHWVKWAITWSKPHNCAWDNILLDSAPLKYVKKPDSKALLKIAPDLLFFIIPTSL